MTIREFEASLQGIGDIGRTGDGFIVIRALTADRAEKCRAVAETYREANPHMQIFITF